MAAPSAAGKVALVTGVTGQDGSYLCELLLSKGYHVYGIIRRMSTINTKRIDHLYNDDRFALRYGDLTDAAGLVHVMQEIQNRHSDVERLEVYNLGAQSHVKVSFELPDYTGEVDALGTLRLLEAVRLLGLGDRVRFYQASTSELYGKVQHVPQSEETPFYPRSPYGVAKLYGFWIVKNYRESYNMFACNGILFNHESPRRGETFVTRKITIGLGKIIRGEQECLTMGNIDAKRDWGHAKDYVYGMWLILQHDTPDDYVLATETTTSVRVFIEYCFAKRGMNLRWEGKDVNEVGIDQNGVVRIKISEKYFRPAEVELLLGDATKARQTIGWKPSYTWEQLADDMLDSDAPVVSK